MLLARVGVPQATNRTDFNYCRDFSQEKLCGSWFYLPFRGIASWDSLSVLHAEGKLQHHLSLDLSGVVNNAELQSLLSFGCLEVALHSYTLSWINI